MKTATCTETNKQNKQKIATCTETNLVDLVDLAPQRPLQISKVHIKSLVCPTNMKRVSATFGLTVALVADGLSYKHEIGLYSIWVRGRR